MSDEERSEQEAERPRPRVVDKRVSTNPEGAAAARKVDPPPAAAPAADPASTSSSPSAAGVGAPQPQPEPPAPAKPGRPAAPGEQVWTPEQEAEARRMAEEIAATPSIEWVVNTAVSLANIAATKLDLNNAADASLPIDALAGILDKVGDKLGNVEQPLRQTLAQLQMAFAERANTPPSPG